MKIKKKSKTEKKPTKALISKQSHFFNFEDAIKFIEPIKLL